ncbi:hypothetical protein PFICI_01058 [Pestalotiopsis fici W106-1]|uniref:Enoyl reductase (ER) domain-containing protein n=1 Tax=Pestalotiopsis fici (strain W106-1 / CGMCC3.15140) TaxID=1229662 RepID=W3XMS4_PESFW|nr:uncharacterized protein PFICI_01058 [Pestalotiopsis fici W106-1]ETS87230.1 hypothetical protein PFICI_01058 [Pestalotiopsis fici W106-1]
MAEVPVVQILQKDNYANQHIVSLPDEVPYPPLTNPSSLRIRTKVLSLTVNNLTYAKLGFLLKWWDFHPLPPSTPSALSDPAKYGRTNCWGYAEVLESTVTSVSKGSYLFGYLPLGNLAQDVTVKEGEVSGQVLITNDYRQGIMPIYNRYLVFPASLREQIDAKADTVAMDAAVRIMYETSYLLNHFAFAEKSDDILHPASDTSRPWGTGEADLAGATVILFAPGSKVAAAFAFELRHARKQAKAKRIIGAASEYSKSFVEGTGLYDEVVSTSSSPTELLAKWQVGPEDRVVIVDFGGRAGVAPKWAAEIQKTNSRFTILSVGPSISASSPQDVLQSMGSATGGAIISSANDMRSRAIEKLGEQEYWKGLNSAWEGFRNQGIKGLKFKWGHGMDDVKKGWDALCTGSVVPEEGLVFLL